MGDPPPKKGKRALLGDLAGLVPYLSSNWQPSLGIRHDAQDGTPPLLKLLQRKLTIGLWIAVFEGKQVDLQAIQKSLSIRVVSTIQIQHTESYRCVLRAIGIEKQVSQPHIVSKTIAANRFESYRFVSVSVGVCFEGPFGARRAAASCCCAGGCLAREALAKSLRGCLEETLFGEMESQENRLRLLQADSTLNTSQGSSGQLQPAKARNQPNSAS